MKKPTESQLYRLLPEQDSIVVKPTFNKFIRMNQTHHEGTKPYWRGAVILSLELPCSASASASSNDATFERVVVTDSNTPRNDLPV